MSIDTVQDPTPDNLPTPSVEPDDQATPPSPMDKIRASIDAAGKRMDGIVDPPAVPPATDPATPPVDPVQPTEPPASEPPKTVKLKVRGKELDVPEAELVNLAQMGADYTAKTMELAQERKRLEAWNALTERIQTDPQFAAHVFGYGQQPQPQGKHSQTADEAPTDPIERLKWETAMETEKRILAKLAPVLEQTSQKLGMTEHQVVIAQTRQAVQSDPLFSEVMPLVQQYVQNQPSVELQQRAYQMLDSDPRAFVEVYGALRTQVEAQKAAQAATPPPAAPSAQQKPAPMQRQAPPTLEGAGASQAAKVADAKTDQERAKLARRIKENNAKPNEIGRYLELSGALSRL